MTCMHNSPQARDCAFNLHSFAFFHRFLRDWSLITGRGVYKTGGGGGHEVLPLQKGGEVLAMRRGGAKRFGVVFTW